MHTIPGAPTTFYTTTIRPDPNRQAKVQIVALDARQLELEMAIGVEGPYPPDEATKGKWIRHGMLPREKKVATRVVAAFNGGFKFDQGAWGMTIDRRVFMPPVKDVASLLMHDDGRLGFGSWGPAMKTPDDVRSLRQNLDPLIDDGVVNPRKRLRWGGIKAEGTIVGQRAKRTGICRTAAGDFLYLWGNDIEAQDLGNAMKKAGCDYGIHLDMNVYHVGFVFMSFEDETYDTGEAEVLWPNMGANKKRYTKQPSPKEFFYATLREPVPAPIADGVAFAGDGLAQPAPTWLPGVVIAKDGDVRLTRFDASRVRLRHAEAGAEQVTGDDASLVLAAMPLAVDPSNASAKGSLVIDGGKALAAPNDLVLAAGVDAKGNLFVAEKHGPLATPAALVASLVRAGCVRAVASRAGAKLERMGRDEILVGGAEPRLFVLAAKPPAATYRFDLDEKGAPRWPKTKTPVPK